MNTTSTRSSFFFCIFIGCSPNSFKGAYRHLLCGAAAQSQQKPIKRRNSDRRSWRQTLNCTWAGVTHRFDDTTETKGFYQGVTRDTVCLSEKKKKTFITTAINNMSRMYSGVSYVRQQNRNKPQTTCREQQNRRVVISTEPFDSLPSQQVKNKRLLLQEVEAQRVTGSEQSSEIARHPRINRWRRTRRPGSHWQNLLINRSHLHLNTPAAGAAALRSAAGWPAQVNPACTPLHIKTSC